MRGSNVVRIIAALTVFFLHAAPADAQVRHRQRHGPGRAAGVIEGAAVDAGTGVPLAGARVLVEGTTRGAFTDADGAYVITSVPPGRHDLVASMLGYRNAVKEVDVPPGETVTVDFELTVSPIEMGAVVVTGTRTPTHVEAAAVRTEVVTARRIEEKGAQNLYQALQGLAGVRVEQRCAACNYSTVRMQGLESGHVQVLIDGQPIYSSLASVYGLQQIPAAMIERIEVVKGAGSALYGSSAIAGVINIITKTPTLEPRLDVSTSFGTARTNAYSVNASRSLGTVDAIVTAQKNTGAQIDEDGDGLTDRVESDNVSLSGRLNAYNLLGDDRLSLNGATVGAFRRGGALATWDNPFAAAAEHIETDRREVGLGYRVRLRDGGEASLNVVHAAHGRNATNDAFRSDYEDIHGEPPPLDDMRPYVADEDVFVLDGTYSRPVGSHRFLVGVQYAANRLRETGRYIHVDPTDPDYGGTFTSESEKRADDVAVYLQDDIEVTDAVELVLGARYDVHHSTDEFAGSGAVAPGEAARVDYDEGALNPRIALRLAASPRVTLRASVGTGFRVPYGFSEELHLCSGSPRIYKPADLRPERSTSVNLTAEYSTPRLVASANLFRTDLRGKIGFTDAGDDVERMGYTYEWRNLGDALTQGLELGLKAALRTDLVAELSAAFTDARYRDERPDWAASHPELADESRYIPRVPRLSGRLGLSHTPGPWSLTLDLDYTGRMYIDYCQDQDLARPGSKIVHTPRFYVVDARVARELAGGLTVFAGAHNLLDRVQRERHRDDPGFIYAPYTGRVVYAGGELSLH